MALPLQGLVPLRRLWLLCSILFIVTEAASEMIYEPPVTTNERNPLQQLRRGERPTSPKAISTVASSGDADQWRQQVSAVVSEEDREQWRRQLAAAIAASEEKEWLRRELALLDLSQEDRRQRRRQLATVASSWRLFGANIPFSNGPTLSALNMSFFRHDSVTPPAAKDWRSEANSPVTPILIQWNCASCWAVAAADTVAMAAAIATSRPAVAPAIQQICDCAGLGCCNGGWPEDAFAWLVSQGSVTSASSYVYWAMDGRTCVNASTFPTAGNVTGWERVPSFSSTSLMKAVTRQPVMVYISASSRDFLNYSSTAPGTAGFKIYDGNCTTEVNHALVVVGFNTSGPVPYWILKNSWPSFGWGDNGYMYIKLHDGQGKCGMLTVNPVYPTYYPKAPIQATVRKGSNFPAATYSDSNSYWWTKGSPQVSDACTGFINPCGGGTCYTSNGIARCICPLPYVELIGVPTSKCVNPSPCTTALFNPCGSGTCSNVGDGSYTCLCAAGYVVGTLVSGAPTCIPYTGATTKYSYVTQYGDTCDSVQLAYSMTSAAFLQLNPGVVCPGQLVPGIALNLNSTYATACRQQYAATPTDSCSGISQTYSSSLTSTSTTSSAYMMNADTSTSSGDSLTSGDSTTSSTSKTSTSTALNADTTSSSSLVFTSPSYSAFTSINPTISCSSKFYSNQILCVDQNIDTSVAPVLCTRTYSTVQGDTCAGVATNFALTSTAFLGLNPGINCNFNGGSIPVGVDLCVNTMLMTSINCTQWYTVQQGDTCAQIWNAAGLSQYQLSYINPGLQCQAPFLYVGEQVCVDSPSLANIADPNYLVYTVQPNDTWGVVQSQFVSKCRRESITIPKIAAQNNISNWVSYTFVAGAYLVIPCVPVVGASCGCVASIQVCGTSFTNYASYCDARCNFDTPAPNGACSTCQNACQGRYGQAPSPASACAAGYVCPFPTWPPPSTDAAAMGYQSAPLCSYRGQTCTMACTIYNSVMGVTSSVCSNTCMGCARIPCSGQSEVVAVGGFPCPTCSSSGCQLAGKSTTLCMTTCPYWNSLYSPINV